MTAGADLVSTSMIDRNGRGRVAQLTIERPAKLNALDPATIRALTAAAMSLSEDANLRAAIVTGAGDRAFIGGADIDTMAGLELAAACDLRLAAENAVFGMPEVKVGMPSVIEAALLPRLVGWGRAARLLLLGENIDAAEALAIGLVEKVVARAELDVALGAWIDAILAAGAGAVRLQKALMRDWERLPLDAAIQSGIASFRASFSGEEPHRMLTSFIERRGLSRI